MGHTQTLNSQVLAHKYQPSMYVYMVCIVAYILLYVWRNCPPIVKFVAGIVKLPQAKLAKQSDKKIS